MMEHEQIVQQRYNHHHVFGCCLSGTVPLLNLIIEMWSHIEGMSLTENKHDDILDKSAVVSTGDTILTDFDHLIPIIWVMLN